jgi:choline kinase/phosphatidylglycerophosphate synthase/beta-phosphoglucomutase-like phosphatase (HAD superfamily)
LKTCVIIAAGKGTRLSDRGPSKPLVRVLGLPLIERTIRTAAKSGLTDFYVVIGYRGSEVRAFLADLATRMDVRITPVFNADWEAGNGLSVLKARDFVGEDFVLLMADHVFDPEILNCLLRERLGEEKVRLAVDYGVANDRIDVEDVTKVMVEGERITCIGKELDAYNAYDTGIFLCSPALFEAIETCWGRDEGGSLSAAIRVLAAQGRVEVFDIQGRFWMDVDDERALRRAEAELLASLSSKSADGWVSRRLNRPISSGLLTPLLLRVYPAVTPNQVSVVSFLVALVSAACFFADTALAGAVLLQASSVLDGCDGEIARLKHLQSKMGDYLDAVLDRYADSAMFAGIGFYAFARVGNQEVLGVTWAPLLIAIVTAMAVVGHLMVSYTSAKSEVNFNYKYAGKWIAAGRGRDMRLFTLFGFGLATYFHPVAALAGLMLTAAHTNLIVGWRLLVSWQMAQSGSSPALPALVPVSSELRPEPADPALTVVAGDRGRVVFEDGIPSGHDGSPGAQMQLPLVQGSIEAVIFDFDGTLADTMPFLTELAVELITEEYRMAPSPARERYLETSGLTFANQLQEIFPGHPRNTAVAVAFEAQKAAGIYGKPLFADAIPALRYLRDQGVKTFVCSSTRYEIILKYTSRAQLDALVESVSGYRTGQDKSAQIDAVLAGERLAPESVLFVGDSWKDYLLARDKNMQFILICRGSAAGIPHQEEVASMASLDALKSLFGHEPIRARSAAVRWS